MMSGNEVDVIICVLITNLGGVGATYAFFAYR